MSRWTSYRRHLLLSMGLTPLALAGCGVEQEQSPFDGDDISELQELPAAALAPPLALAGDAFLTGQYLSYQVNGAAPYARVFLAGGTRIGGGICPPILAGACLGIVDAELLDSAVADAFGRVSFELTLPYRLDDGLPLALQAVASGSASNVLSGRSSHVPRTCGEDPFLDDTNYYSVWQTLACFPAPSAGACPDYSNLSYPQVERIWRLNTGVPYSTGGGGFDLYLSCNETSVETACCYGGNVSQWVVGRPFTVAGEVRLATSGDRADWAAEVNLDASRLPRRVRRHLARRWTETARGEHASVASFARFALHLAQVGAPADLMADATRAMADEIRHARDAFGVAAALDDSCGGPGPMDTSTEAVDTEAIVIAAVREGCIAETIAAAQAAAGASTAQDATLRELLEGVAADEQRHAGLAWRFVRWALTAHPELRPAVEAAFADLPNFEVLPGGAMDEVERAWGLLPEGDMNRVATEVLRDVVGPCARQLLGEPAPGPIIAEA